MLSAEEVSAARGLVWDMLEGFGSGIRRDEPESWGPPHWPNTGSSGILGMLGTQHACPGPSRSGRAEAHVVAGCNHSEAAWFVRGARGVRSAFSQLWQTEDLLCSFDNIW